MSTKQNLPAADPQCFARVPSGSTPQQPMKPVQKPTWEAHKEPSPRAAHGASSPIASQMKAALELTLPTQTEMPNSSF